MLVILLSGDLPGHHFFQNSELLYIWEFVEKFCAQMATIDEDSSSSEKPNASSSLQQFEGGNDVYSAQKLKTLGEETAVPWINYAVQQALLAQRTIESATENAIASTKSRLESIRTTSSAHFSQTLVSSIFFFRGKSAAGIICAYFCDL